MSSGPLFTGQAVKKYVLTSQPSAEGPRLGIDYAAELNPAQLEAVTTTDGPVLVIAGAGSGKTRTLIYRVAYLVEQGISPQNILLLTFTRKSAEEMMHRASRILDDRCRYVQGGTFHSYAHNVLRRHSSAIGFPNNFLVVDRGDAEDLINLLRTDRGLTDKEKRFPKKGTLLDIFSKSVNTNTDVEKILKKDYPEFLEDADEIRSLGEEYTAFKRKQALMDYDDLLVYLRTLLEDCPEQSRALAQDCHQVMIDEYQDTNVLQADIAKALSSAHGNILAVGDDCQSIYSFRGAHFRNIIDFPKVFPGTRVILLEQNYRSTSPVLQFTNALIESAEEKFTKQLYSNLQGIQRPVCVKALSFTEQAEFVCQRVLELREEGVPLNEMAVLFRAGWHSNELEVELASRNIPFVKYGGLKFVETAHIKDLIAVLRVAFNPYDSVSWYRVLLLLEGIGPKTARGLVSQITEQGGTLEALVSAKKKAAAPELMGLKTIIERLRSEANPPEAQVRSVLKFYQPLLQKNYEDHRKRVDDLDSLVRIAERYETIPQFLTDITLDPPSGSQVGATAEDRDDEQLVLSTVHSAKGLEWHSVFILSLIDGYLPSSQSLHSRAEIEEERRLLYVACTRAKNNLYMVIPEYSAAKGYSVFHRGFAFSEPSRFLTCIPEIEGLIEQWDLTTGTFY